MPYSDFRSISDVALCYQVTYQELEFVQPQPIKVSDYFFSELAFTLSETDYGNAEVSVCENIIYPVLREVWKHHLKPLMLRGHEPLRYDERLSGAPDYVVSRRSPLGKVVRGSPYVLLVIEAKRDDFEYGWGQCLAAMVAAQKLNRADGQTIHGIVASGRTWEFGRLVDASFTHESRVWTVQNAPELLAAVNYVFTQCSEAVTRMQAVA